MVAIPQFARKPLLRMLAALTVLAAAACEPVSNAGLGGRLGSGDTVQVALLVPAGSAEGGAILAQSLENAARLAIADLDGADIDLRVYDTAGQASLAADAARRAASDGADVILGPVFASAANAAGLAVADQGINVLAFSNNSDIAGGNVFVLGPTFENTADRLARHAARQGKGNIFIVNARDTSEQIGRAAITKAIAGSGARLAGQADFELSQQGIVRAAPQMAAQIQSSGADAVFLTSGTAGALPFLADLLPANGVSPATTQYIGLQRLDIPASALTLQGLQGAWFALPDQSTADRFRARYAAAYGSNPHPIAGLAYDGIAAVGALARRGDRPTAAALTQSAGFAGTGGPFRLLRDGSNERALAVAEIRNNQVVVIDPAPRSFGGFGF